MSILKVTRKIGLGVLMVGMISLSACDNEESLDGLMEQNSSILENNTRSKEKNYSYNVEDIYTAKVEEQLRSRSAYDVTYVIPTVYKGENYDFQITTLSEDGQKFNVTFEKDGKKYSSDFYVEKNTLFAVKDGVQTKDGDSFLSCVASHEGTALGFLTGACAGVASFIPFLQPLAFACAAETAVIASMVAADCAINK